MPKGYKEVRGKLGFFGFISRLLFWGWQALMLIWFFSYTADVAPLIEGATSGAERAGAGLGIAISWGIILFFWVGGTVILGLFLLLTRPARAMVPIDEDSRIR